MGRRKQAKGARNGASKKAAAAKPGAGYDQLSGVGPRYQKYDQFTQKKRLLTDFCVDMTLLSLFGFLAIVCLSFFHSDEYKYIVSLIFGDEANANEQMQD